MAIIRFKALEQVFDRKPNHVVPPSDKTSDYFAETNACAITLSKHFAINPPQLKIKVCPWELLGVRAKVKAIALKYSVPATMVTMDVGSALSY